MGKKSKDIIFHDLGLDQVSDTMYNKKIIQQMKEYFLELLNYDLNLGDEHDQYFFSRELGKSIRYLDHAADSEVGLFQLNNIQYILKRYWKHHKYYGGEYMKLDILIEYYQIQNISRQLMTKEVPTLSKFGFENKKMEIVNDPYLCFETHNSYWTVMPYASGKNHNNEYRSSVKDYVRRMFMISIYNMTDSEVLADQVASINIMIGNSACLTDVGKEIPLFIDIAKDLGTKQKLQEKLYKE